MFASRKDIIPETFLSTTERLFDYMTSEVNNTDKLVNKLIANNSNELWDCMLGLIALQANIPLITIGTFAGLGFKFYNAYCERQSLIANYKHNIPLRNRQINFFHIAAFDSIKFLQDENQVLREDLSKVCRHH